MKTRLMAACAAILSTFALASAAHATTVTLTQEAETKATMAGGSPGANYIKPWNDPVPLGNPGRFSGGQGIQNYSTISSIVFGMTDWSAVGLPITDVAIDFRVDACGDPNQIHPDGTWDSAFRTPGPTLRLTLINGATGHPWYSWTITTDGSEGYQAPPFNTPTTVGSPYGVEQHFLPPVPLPYNSRNKIRIEQLTADTWSGYYNGVHYSCWQKLMLDLIKITDTY